MGYLFHWLLWRYCGATFERAKRYLLVDAGGIAPASRRGLTAGYYIMVGVYVGALGWTDSPSPPGWASSKPYYSSRDDTY